MTKSTQSSPADGAVPAPGEQHDKDPEHNVDGSAVSIAGDLARLLPAPGGGGPVHRDIEEEAHGQALRGVASDGSVWVVVPPELVVRLREVLGARLPSLPPDGVDVEHLARELAGVAWDWQREQRPVYRGGVVL